MKNVLLLLVLFYFFVPLAFAHIAGQPPFFLMNGKYADFYPVYTTSLPQFTLPQDIAPETYLINQPIKMEIDKGLLPFPPETIEQITFTWDFGDGTKGEGLENTHSYSRIGSYLLTVHADYGEYSGTDAQPIIQAVLLHILPNKEYKLPQAVITANGKKIADPLIETVTTSEKKDLILDASSSIQGTTQIKEYYWDLGNGKDSKEKTINYLIQENQTYTFPFVRVKDANGFISDSYVQIENDDTSPEESKTSFFSRYWLPLLLGGNALIFITALRYILKKRPS